MNKSQDLHEEFEYHYRMFKDNYLLPLLSIPIFVYAVFNIVSFFGNGFHWSQMPYYHKVYLFFALFFFIIVGLYKILIVEFQLFRDDREFKWPKVIFDLLFNQTALQIGLFIFLMGRIGIGVTDFEQNLYDLMWIYIIYISINFVFFNILGFLFFIWREHGKDILLLIIGICSIISFIVAYIMATSNFGFDLSGAEIVDSRPHKYAGVYFLLIYSCYLVVSIRNYKYLSRLLIYRDYAINFNKN
ncbi:hypothetical protein KFV05_09145 [Macrococcoides canis]|uniref:hypothetical protein n=1 Tax=Macrococcoides canis TaxID=1855823 RepID=UPI0020B6DDE3|nr:hypothetical protein [Macrococcus canis]UTH01876.1 hypothetical protein KFV05_09145 [Macrococcus canis]